MYAIEVWGGVYMSAILPLILLQKKAIRHVCLASRLAHTEPLFLSASILPLRKLYAYQVLIYSIKNLYHLQLPRTTSVRISKYTYSFKPRTTKILMSYEAHLVRLLNNVPANLINLACKPELKIHMLQIDIDTVLYGVS